VEKVVKSYIASNEDSLFEKSLNEKFAKNSVNYIKRIIETKAFKDPGSAFFAELKLNNLLTKRIKEEFLKNASAVEADLLECNNIMQKLDGGEAPRDPSPSLSPVKVNTAQLEEEFKNGAAAFVKDYIAANEDSLFEKALEKHGKDVSKLVRAIIDENAFENADSAFFSGLGFNNLLTKRIKA
jgi:hypothetical protein